MVENGLTSGYRLSVRNAEAFTAAGVTCVAGNGVPWKRTLFRVDPDAGVANAEPGVGLVKVGNLAGDPAFVA